VVQIGQAQHVLGRALTAGFLGHGGGLLEPPRNDRPLEYQPRGSKSRELTAQLPTRLFRSSHTLIRLHAEALVSMRRGRTWHPVL
jgi:hypothetical protein